MPNETEPTTVLREVQGHSGTFITWALMKGQKQAAELEWEYQTHLILAISQFLDTVFL